MREFTVVWKIDFAGQRDIAVLGFAKLPVHFEIVHQILPAVAGADIADRPARETGAACHNQVNVFALSVDEFDTADFGTPPGVAGAVARDVRSQQRVESQLPAQRFVEYFDLGVHEQHRPMRIGEDMFYEPIATARLRIRETIEEAIALRVFDRVIQIAFFLVAKRFAVADEKLKVARVRLIDVWIVNLVDDAVAQREPEAATGMIGSPHAFFRARSPARLDSRRAKRD